MSGLLSHHARLDGQAKSLRGVFAFFTGLMAMTVIACAPASKPEPPVVTIFAAASLTEALGQIAEDYERQTGQAVRLSFAGSGSVARQVEAGAPADIVILADQSWMDRLGKAGRLSFLRKIQIAKTDPMGVRMFKHNNFHRRNKDTEGVSYKNAPGSDTFTE